MDAKRTSIGDLTSITTAGVRTKLWHGWSNLGQTLNGGSISRTLIFGQGDLFLLAGLGILDFDSDGDDLVVKPTRLLSDLGSPERFTSIFVLLSSGDVEIIAHVLRGLNHGLHAVGRFLVGHQGIREGLFGATTIAVVVGHALTTQSETDINAAIGDLVGNILHGFETAGTESVDAAGTGGVRDSGGKRGGSNLVGCFDIADLRAISNETCC